MVIPQVIVTLNGLGILCIELPGAGGGRRTIELNEKTAGAVLRRVLEGQMEGKGRIGELGAPTQGQVRNWELGGREVTKVPEVKGKRREVEVIPTTEELGF